MAGHFFPPLSSCTIGFPVDEVEFLDLVFPQAGDLCLSNRPEEEVVVDGITGVKVFGWGTTDPFISRLWINTETSNINAAKYGFYMFWN